MKSVNGSLMLRVFIIIVSGLLTTQTYTRADSLGYGEENTTMIMVEEMTEATMVEDSSETGWAWYPMAWRWWTIAQVICAILGVFDNGVVIVIIFQRVKKNRSTDTLIGALAIADLLTSVFLFPLPWAKHVPATILGRMYCKLLYPGFALWLCITASTYLLNAICIERYIAVVYPLYFNRVFTKAKVSIAVAFVWLLAFAQCVYTFFVYIYDDEIENCNSLINTDVGRVVHAYYAFSIRLAIPVLIMVITQILIIRSLHVQSKRFQGMRGDVETNYPPSFHITARNNVIKMMLIVVCVYVITWTPNQIAYLLFNLGYISSSYRGSPLHRSLTVFAFLNSCANPIIYTSRHTEFRQALASLFTCSKPEIASLFAIKDKAKESPVAAETKTENIPQSA
ncbi:D(3) dopamine receptor-like [Strongylocentrotus purpuratus]|uniref:G-protein coupled receptors family 1 profile domain-containing protein n=1 Tax=Strongylocentrotus purpuratus TaxID=7668 RepID=A0A7M7LPR0_STRPU|nr:D(3) dopamine receptor-like [Strongylocentrotus purpuratus]